MRPDYHYQQQHLSKASLRPLRAFNDFQESQQQTVAVLAAMLRRLFPLPRRPRKATPSPSLRPRRVRLIYASSLNTPPYKSLCATRRTMSRPRHHPCRYRPLLRPPSRPLLPKAYRHLHLSPFLLDRSCSNVFKNPVEIRMSAESPRRL